MKNALVRVVLLLTALCAALAVPGFAAEYVDDPPALIDRLTPDMLEAVFPGAGRLEPVDGPPAAVAVYDGEGALAGYIFSTLDLIRARGFTSTPFDVLAGVTLDGRITGVKDAFHREPHIYNDDRRIAQLATFLASIGGVPFNHMNESGRQPDFVSGATISARAMRFAVGDASRIVMRGLVGLPEVTEPTLDVDGFAEKSVAELIADGSIRTVTITNAEVQAAFAAAGFPNAVPEMPMRGEPGDTYIQLFTGLATPAAIGRNAISNAAIYDRIANDYPPGTQAIIMGSEGRYDFQGFKFQNASSGYLLDRIEIVQGDQTYAFHRDDYVRAPGSLGPYSGLLILQPETGFDPLLPWTAVLQIHAVGAGAGGTPVTVTFPLDYELPALHILMPEPEPEPLWVPTWRDARGDLIILGVALTVLTLIFLFQAQLARHRHIHRWVRIGFLSFTVVWIGYIAGAQFSITHVVNYLKAPFEGIGLDFYLLEPLIFCLAIYIAISLVLIGRGVFCGWLCPFGALQELTHKFGRLLRLPEWNPPARVQKWMWLPKYGTASLVIGAAFFLPEMAATAEEIEPFKTAITSAFARTWPFVIYAGLIIGISLFTERAFCRFLCPLGGVLAVLDRLHLVNRLKRRPECGSPCQLCSRSCPVKAIVPSGKIVMAECFQCLDCQVEYYDDQRCPPLAKARKVSTRAAARPALGQPVPALARAALLPSSPGA